MKLLPIVLIICLGLGLAPASAEQKERRNGDDTFVSGETIAQDIDTPGDTFVTARAATIGGTSLGDLHITGFSVSVHTAVAEDVYAAGATVDVSADIGGDLSAVGFTVRTSAAGRVSGNARLMGNTVSIESPVDGALTAGGQSVILNAPIRGDVRITAKSLELGPDASVTGILTYSTKDQITVPASVAPPDRVRFEKLDASSWGNVSDGWQGKDMPVFATAASKFTGFIISLLFFMVLGALALGFAPGPLERMRENIIAAPGRSILLGVIGLSLLIGLLPMTALTIVGIPFIPVVLLAIITIWTVGYALGAYTVAMQVWMSLGGSKDPHSAMRILLLAAAVTVIALLNFIPFVGWIANLTLVLIGSGAITRRVFARLVPDPDPVPA